MTTQNQTSCHPVLLARCFYSYTHHNFFFVILSLTSVLVFARCHTLSNKSDRTNKSMKLIYFNLLKIFIRTSKIYDLYVLVDRSQVSNLNTRNVCLSPNLLLIGTSAGVATGYRSEGELATMFVDHYFHRSVFYHFSVTTFSNTTASRIKKLIQ